MENNTMEATNYHYENAGQFRAIANVLGYDETYKDGMLTFSKADEKHTFSLAHLKAGNQSDERDSILEQSKERVVTFFDKDEASNNFEQYSDYLKSNHNLAIVKWDNLKEGKEGFADGFTIIDLDKKISYTGADLYKYAYEANYVLDGKGAAVDIPLSSLKEVGIKPENLNIEDLDSLRTGKKTGMLNLSIEDNKANRELLKNEKVDYKAEDGKLNFEGKIGMLRYLTADNTPENKSILKKNEIDFNEQGNRLKIEGINFRKIAIAAIILTSPIAGIALLLVAKKKDIKNDMALSKQEIKALKDGAVISRTNSKQEKVLMQLDKDTNDLVSIKARDIAIPNKIGGIQLSPMQKEALKNGREITITNDTQTANVRLDLNAKNGIAVVDTNGIEVAQQTAQKATQVNINPENIISNKDRLEYTAQRGIKGIDDIFRNDPSGKESFLKEHKLDTQYNSYKELDNQYAEEMRGDNHSTTRLISEKQKTIDNAIKSVAKEAGVQLSYGKDYGTKASTNSKIKI